MGRKIRLPGTSMGPFFFRKCGTWMGVPVLIGTSMGHFLSLRYIDVPFFIIGTSTGLISKAVKTYFDRKAVKTRLKPVKTGLNRSKCGQNLKLGNTCQGL